jgi:subtilisin family serine protease
MSIFAKYISAALASALALAVTGCGQSGPRDPDAGPTPPIVIPPNAGLLPEPKVQYALFEPRTERELMGLVEDGEFRGKAMANYGYMIAKTKAGFDPALFAKHGMEVRGSFAANGGRDFYLHKDSDLVETMKRVRGLSGLAYIEPELMNYTTAAVEYNNPDNLVRNGQQYGVLTTHALDAWTTHGFGPNKPYVANIDTGVNYRHEDLADVVSNAFTWYSNGQSMLPNGNVFADPDPADWKVTRPNQDWGTDGSRDGHGTHTVGTMAAVGNNGLGVAGMCWQVNLVSYKGIDDNDSGPNWPVYGSLWHLAKWKNELVGPEGAKAPRYPHTIPVNMSLGSPVMSQFQIDMVRTALENGIVVIASSGNNYNGISTFPGSVTGVIRVGAVNYLDRRTDYSNYGPDLSVMAPGHYVFSCYSADNQRYQILDGTSMAAPHVTGLVAHMLTFAPDLTPEQIKTYLERNADPIEGQTGFSNWTGWGRINALKTISAVIGDLGRTPASDYVASPLKVNVEIDGKPMNGMVVYLYNCDQGGAINNYVVASITGESYVAMRDDATIESESGVAWFSMLRPGHYRVVAATTAMSLEDGKVAAYSAASDVFEVRQDGGAPPVTLSFDFDVMYIQTLATAAGGGNTDTVISIYNSVDGAPLVNDFDGDAFESLMVVRPTKPGAWWIRIRPWNGNSAYSGEYALWVGSPPAVRAPGTYANPGDGGVQGSQTQTRSAASQLIGVNDKIVYGRLTAGASAGGDYYRIVVE